MLLEEGDALLQVLAAEAPAVVEAVQRVQPGDQDEVQALACTLTLLKALPRRSYKFTACSWCGKVHGK